MTYNFPAWLQARQRGGRRHRVLHPKWRVESTGGTRQEEWGIIKKTATLLLTPLSCTGDLRLLPRALPGYHLHHHGMFFHIDCWGSTIITEPISTVAYLPEPPSSDIQYFCSPRSGGGRFTTSSTWSCRACWSPAWPCWGLPSRPTAGRSSH